MKVSKELKIGIFVVVVLVAAFFIINFLRGEDIFNRSVDLRARYDNVEGLVASAPVYIKGYKAGSVASVVYLPDEDVFEVTCSVPKEFNVPADSRLVLYGVDIMGGKGVKVLPGVSSVQVEDGALLQGEYEPDLMSSLGSGIGPLMAKLESALDSLSVTIGSVNGMLGEENRAKVSGALSHLERTIANAERISATIGGKSAELTEFIDNLNSLSVKFNSLAENADTLISNVNGVAGQLNASDIEGVVASLQGLLESIRNPDGSLGRLLSDDSVYGNVDSLLSDIDALVQEIKKNPKKYIRISVF